MAQFDQASTYEKSSSNQREDGQFLIDLIDFKDGNKVLDIGCGTGYLTKVLANKVGPSGMVVGIDPDIQRLQVAMEKYPAENLQYLLGSAEDIPGTDYDVIFSNSVLHWCKDKDLVFKQMKSSLKTGGTLAFVALADFDIEETYLIPPANMVSPEYRKAMMTGIHIIPTYDFLQLSSAHNFSLVYFKKHFRKWTFESVDKLVEFYMTHFRGCTDPSHFNVEAMKEHYVDGITIPYITVVLKKL